MSAVRIESTSVKGPRRVHRALLLHVLDMVGLDVRRHLREDADFWYRLKRPPTAGAGLLPRRRGRHEQREHRPPWRVTIVWTAASSNLGAEAEATVYGSGARAAAVPSARSLGRAIGAAMSNVSGIDGMATPDLEADGTGRRQGAEANDEVIALRDVGGGELRGDRRQPPPAVRTTVVPPSSTAMRATTWPPGRADPRRASPTASRTPAWPRKHAREAIWARRRPHEQRPARHDEDPAALRRPRRRWQRTPGRDNLAAELRPRSARGARASRDPAQARAAAASITRRAQVEAAGRHARRRRDKERAPASARRASSIGLRAEHGRACLERRHVARGVFPDDATSAARSGATTTRAAP